MNTLFRKLLLPMGILLIYIAVFHSWLAPGLITGGDLTYLSLPTMQDQTLFPFAWMNNQNNGLGGYAVPFLNNQYNESLIHIFSHFGWSWSLVERVTQLFPLLALLIIASYCLSRFLSKKFSFLTFLTFSFNTYLLMLAGGGQILVAISYASVPIGFYLFYLLIGKAHDRYLPTLLLRSILFSAMVGIELMIDLRFAYILMVLCGFYFVFTFMTSHKKMQLVKNLFFIFGIPFVITGLFNTFWLLPFLFVRENPFQQLGSAYNSLQAVQFLSFATFENAIGLLHPLWPENIFGKSYFMRPEFLLLPILAFGSLFLMKPFESLRSLREKQEYKQIIFFAMIGIIGVFLAKGANYPFGNIYLFLFNHAPGFMLFRDSTKWYVLIAISYSVLIPFTVEEIRRWLTTQKKFSIKSKIFTIQNLFIFLVAIYLLFLIRLALFTQLGGSFTSRRVPQDYNKLNVFLSSSSMFSRILWVPGWERYGFYSFTHPAVSAINLYNATSSSQLLEDIALEKSKAFLESYSIHYIVVPYDVNGELFQSDRKYDAKQYDLTVKILQNIPWMHEIKGFGKNHVFVLDNPKNLFLTTNSTAQVGYTKIDMTHYVVQVKNVQKGDIVIFSQAYDDHWVAKIGDTRIASKPTEYGLNSFILPKDGNYQADVYYTPQKWVNLGLTISFASALGVILYFVYSGVKVWQSRPRT